MRPAPLLQISCALALAACTRTGLDVPAIVEDTSTSSNEGGHGPDPGGSFGGAGGAGGQGGSGARPTGDPVWSTTAGSLDACVGAYAIAVDGAGNAILAGSFNGTVDFGGGPLTAIGVNDAFVLKLDPDGHHLWSKRFGNSYGWEPGSPQPSATARGVAVDGDGNIVLTGVFNVSADFGGGPIAADSDIFVVKLDPAGGHLWSRGFGDGDPFQFGWGVAVDGAGNAVVVGSINGTVDFGGGPHVTSGIDDVFVLALDPAGNHLWSKHFGAGAGNQQGFAVAADASGNIAITGFYQGPIDFGGGPLPAPLPAPDGDLELFVARFDAGGNHVWSRGFADGSHLSMGNAVAFDPSGNVLVTGGFHDSLDLGNGKLEGATEWNPTAFVAKLGPGGETLWSKAATTGSSNGSSEAFGLAVDGAGDLALTGAFYKTLDLGAGPLESAGGKDIFTAGLAADGEAHWSRRFGDDGSIQEGRAAAARPQGGWLFTGVFSGTVDLGNGPQTSKGMCDLFVAAFEP
jgi:hypothetical protein